MVRDTGQAWPDGGCSATLVAPLVSKGKRAALNTGDRSASCEHASGGHRLHGRRAGGWDVLIGPDGSLVEGGREHVEVLAEVTHLVGRG